MPLSSVTVEQSSHHRFDPIRLRLQRIKPGVVVAHSSTPFSTGSPGQAPNLDSGCDSDRLESARLLLDDLAPSVARWRDEVDKLRPQASRYSARRPLPRTARHGRRGYRLVARGGELAPRKGAQ